MKFKEYLQKYLVISILLLTFLAGVFSQYIRIKGHKENDHWVYYRTAQRIDNGDIKEIYSLKDGALPFRYLPPTMILFSWMSNFEEATSRKIWLVVQSLFFALSFLTLYRVLVIIDSPSPINSITLSFIMFFRYFIDALYCGQIAGMFFFAFSLALYFWIKDKKNLSNQALLFLFFIKIIPGFVILINFIKSKNIKELLKQIFYLILAVLIIHGVYFLWFLMKFGINNTPEIVPLFKNWLQMVQADKDYFDGSTAKNQALRGVLLRLIGSGEQTELLWKTLSVTSLFSLFYFWCKIKMNLLLVKVYAFSLGILLFVLLMPQSLPYQLLKVLIPTLFIVSEFFNKDKRKFKIPLLLVILFCSLATTDLIGFYLAEKLQYYSLPFVSFLLIGFLLINEIVTLERADKLVKT